jgi:hypothetical protein
MNTLNFDLDMFTLLKTNRPVNQNHATRIATNIKTSGMLCNPILVNEKMEVIDGQHRLCSARLVNGFVYYIIADGYSLDQVKALNIIGQKWSNSDYLESFADAGLKDYILFRDFFNKHKVFNLGVCLMICSNVKSQDVAHNNGSRLSPFKKGLYKIGDLEIAETFAMRLKQIEPIFKGYNSSKFASAMIGLFLDKPKVFKFNMFLEKLKLQPTALVQCANRKQYKELIEKIYNYRRKNKVNLRF